MKSTGIVRKIDNLGRITLPTELRRIFNIREQDPIEMFVDDDMIILKKYETSCVFCRSSKDLKEFNSKAVCAECAEYIKNMTVCDC